MSPLPQVLMRLGPHGVDLPVAPVVDHVTVSGPTSVTTGQSIQLSAASFDAAGNALSGRTYTWTSSNPTQCPVNASGQVSPPTGATPGSYQITATDVDSGIAGTYAVQTNSPAVFDPGQISVSAGNGQYTVSQAVAPSAGAGAYSHQIQESTDGGATWTNVGAPVSSLTPAVVVSPRTNGTTYQVRDAVNDTAQTKTTPAKSVTPVATTYKLTWVQQPANADGTRPRGSSQMGRASLTNNGAKVVGATINFTTSDPVNCPLGVASGVTNGNEGAVDQFLHPLAAGTYTITAEAPAYGLTADYTFTVTDAVLVWPPKVALWPGKTYQLVPKDVAGYPIDPTLCDWTSTGGTNVTVSASGLVTVAAGAAAPTSYTVTGTERSSGRTGTCTVWVNALITIPGTFNEPAGLTPIFWSKGKKIYTGEDGTAGTTGPGSKWTADGHFIEEVADAESPYGTAVEMRWWNDSYYGTVGRDDKEGVNGFVHFNNNPVLGVRASEIYYRLILKHSPSWVHQVGGDKLMYFGTAAPASENGMFPQIRTYPDQGPGVYRDYRVGFQNQDAKLGSDTFFYCGAGARDTFAQLGQYNTWEFHCIQESVPGAGDGTLRIWLNGVLKLDRSPGSGTGMHWLSASSTYNGFKGFEWEPYWGGAGGYYKSLSGLPEGLFDWLRFGELYYAGRI